MNLTGIPVGGRHHIMLVEDGILRKEAARNKIRSTMARRVYSFVAPVAARNIKGVDILVGRFALQSFRKVS